MAVFEYRALNSRGQNIKGVVDAESIRAARQKLRAQGIFPTTVTESSRDTGRSWHQSIEIKRRSVNLGELSVMTRQLATLVGAGMPLVEALRALGDQIEAAHLKAVIAEVADQVNEGSSFATALQKHPRIFPRLYMNMVASGEVSGTLEVVLERLADLLESQAALRRKIASAMTYPVLMLVLCVMVIFLLMAYVVPQITGIFQDQKVTLPVPTQIVIALSEFFQQWWIAVAILMVLLGLLFQWYIKQPAGRRRFDGFLLHVPLFGGMVLKAATARLSRNLGTMLASGIEVLTALGIAKNIVGNVVLEEALEKASEGVREGRSLAAELKSAAVFPPLLTHMVAVGERTGQLEQMLLRAANSYELELNAFISGLTSILEPLLIVFLAIIVGGILAAVMLPMLEMANIAGG
jgi:general secretion pathway protein F